MVERVVCRKGEDAGGADDLARRWEPAVVKYSLTIIRQGGPFPPHAVFMKGVASQAVIDGRGSEVIDLLKTNLF